MPKYVIKESQLCSAIEKIIAEELAVRLNEGFWKKAGNVAGKVGKGLVKTADVVGTNIVNPAHIPGNFLKNYFDIVSGKKQLGGGSNKTGKSQVSERFMLSNFGYPKVIATPSGIFKNKYKYELAPKQEFVVDDFLGSGEPVNFGKHYVDRNHGRSSSKWQQQLEMAAETISTYASDTRKVRKLTRDFKRNLSAWLKKRDEVYIEYVSSLNSEKTEK